MTTAVYPGSFNPPTVAHLAIADAARRQGGVDRVELVISSVALGKEHLVHPTVDERVAVLATLALTRPWLAARSTTARLIAEIAAGADAVVLGADKWAQVSDPAWYGGSRAACDEAVAGLPLVLVAPRPPWPTPPDVPGRLRALELHPRHGSVSSTAVRDGRWGWMLPEARRCGLWAAG